MKRAIVLAASLLLVAAACGSSRHESIPAPVAKRLAAESESVAAKLRAGDGCAAAVLARRLHRDMVSAGVPAGAQAAARGLADEIVCVSPAPAATTPAPVVQAPADDGHAKEKNGEGRGHEKHGKQKHGKHGDGDE